MVQDGLRRFTYSKTFVVGFGFLGISIIWPIFNQYIPLFLQAGNPEFEARLLAEGRAIPDIVGFGLGPSRRRHWLWPGDPEAPLPTPPGTPAQCG